MMLMAMMMGGARISLAGGGVGDNDGGVTGAASASIRVDNDGNIYFQTVNAGSGQLNSATDWMRPAMPATAAAYWVRATLVSGTAPSSGILNTWQQLSVDRAWSNDQAAPGTKTSTLTLEIATDSGGANIVASGSYIITATVQ